MCVLWACRDNKPSEKILRAGFTRNDDGAGIAWIEGNKVRWRKGIDNAQDLISEVNSIPLPAIIHCRLVSCGGDSMGLTHPFPITPGVSIALEGSASRVLAHNGHWSAFDDWLKRALFNGGGRLRLPEGNWSDTRAMAWLASTFGMGMLDLIPSSAGKIAVLDGKAKGFNYISGRWFLDDFKDHGYLQSSDVGTTEKESKVVDWPGFYRGLGEHETISMTPCTTTGAGLPDADFSVEFGRKIAGVYRQFRRYVKYDKDQVRIERTTEIVAKGVEIPLDLKTVELLDKEVKYERKKDKKGDETLEFTQEELNTLFENDSEIWAPAYGDV